MNDPLNKPCPFCGSVSLDLSNADDRDDDNLVFMYCNKCSAQGPDVIMEPEHFRPFDDVWIIDRQRRERLAALGAWNRRAGEPE